MNTYSPPTTTIAEQIAYDYGYKQGRLGRVRNYEGIYASIEEELIRQYIGEKQWLVTNRTDSLAYRRVDNAFRSGHRDGTTQYTLEVEVAVTTPLEV